MPVTATTWAYWNSIVGTTTSTATTNQSVWAQWNGTSSSALGYGNNALNQQQQGYPLQRIQYQAPLPPVEQPDVKAADDRAKE